MSMHKEKDATAGKEEMIQLRPYQEDSVNSIFSYFRTHSGNCLVSLPTGSGKSVVIAEFIRRALSQYPHTRVLMLTHVKELVEQNAAALTRLYPEGDVGVYSAGLSRRELGHQITVAGIQSVYSKVEQLGTQHLVIVDECHRISTEGDTMYSKLIHKLKSMNPSVKVIGFTATPFRTKGGALTNGGLFSHMCYDANVKDLVDQGYLSPVISKGALNKADLSDVPVVAGEYNLQKMATAMDKDELTKAAVTETIRFAKDRKKWIIFCAGVEHAQHVADAFSAAGVTSGVITGDTPSDERDSIIADFKAGKIKCITNCDVLTTGFDAPDIDLIVFLRGTKSAGLYVQMIGRGMRLAEGKKDCLVLDFAGNVEHFGPIDLIKVQQGQRKSGISITPMKVCENPECREANFVSARKCVECGTEFEINESDKHGTKASGGAILSGQSTEPDTLRVSSISYKTHKKRGGKRSLKVQYICGIQSVTEYICISEEYKGFPRNIAIGWWKKRTDLGVPRTIDDALEQCDKLRKPKAIQVKKQGKYQRIVGYEF